MRGFRLASRYIMAIDAAALLMKYRTRHVFILRCSPLKLIKTMPFPGHRPPATVRRHGKHFTITANTRCRTATLTKILVSLPHAIWSFDAFL